jgi:hypothetical protein
MDIHKDCYSAIGLTQQDGPDRRETILRAFGISNSRTKLAVTTSSIGRRVRKPQLVNARRTTSETEQVNGA